MVFNATFNNISVILWQSVLQVEETRGPGENHWPVASHWQTLSHNAVQLALIEIRTHNISGDSHWLYRYNVVVNPTTIQPWQPFLNWDQPFVILNDIRIQLKHFIFWSSFVIILKNRKQQYSAYYW